MQKAWWKEGAVYQIYPRSFMDSNGDGIGDLPGIISRLDYLQELGIDVVWLSPVYASPNDDNGYDISDYRTIMHEFGTLKDWEDLLQGLHERGIKLMMDLVVNHSSDEHQWFVEARKSKDNPYRDYYIWRPDQHNWKEPNNWSSIFGGSVWHYDSITDAFYLHLFSAKQPDLNWENPKLRREIYDMMLFWLDKGVDGFRMDVINMISKVEGLPNASGSGQYEWGGQYFMNGPRVHEYLQEMNQEVLTKYDLITVGETPGASTAEAIQYANQEQKELNMIFQFEHMDLDSGSGGKWDFKAWKLDDLKAVLSKWQYDLDGKAWNSLYLNNHDQPRMVSRFGNDGQYRVESAQMLATLLHFMQGTPYIYQGEEIGMTNVRYASIDDYRDLETHNMYREKVMERHENIEHVMESIYRKGRDNARTPMQWDESLNGGFSTGTPWLGVNPNYTKINVRQALQDPNSILYYYRKLLQLRKLHPIIVYGSYQLILADHDRIYAYIRQMNDERLLIILNFSEQPTEFFWPKEHLINKFELLIANYPVNEDEGISTIKLKPFEARVYKFTVNEPIQ